MDRTQHKPNKEKKFADYRQEGGRWITLSTGEYYPDILIDACILFEPVIIQFGQLVRSSPTSAHLLRLIATTPNPMRVQLLRIFRRYVCPIISVEATKRVGKIEQIIQDFGSQFRPIQDVQAAYEGRPIRDEALCALLWEYKDRGKQGYDLTEEFFTIFQGTFPDLPLLGPIRAGKDIFLSSIFSNLQTTHPLLPSYPNQNRPVDFVIYRDQTETEIATIGLARYDSDRGGAQEDDRIGGYQNCADEILTYAKNNTLRIKVIFLNDGPGLLLGSMWRDYAVLEQRWPGKIMVLTLRMVPERLTHEWLLS